MKKRMLIPVGIVAAAVATVALSAGAAARPGSGRTLEFVAVQKHFIETSTHPGLGDRVLFTDLAYNRTPQFGRPAGAVIGRDEAVCTVVSSTPPGVQCTLTAHLPNGQLVMAGEGDPAKHVSRWAVVGGLGAYTGSRGSIVVTALSQTKSLVVVDLSAG